MKVRYNLEYMESSTRRLNLQICVQKSFALMIEHSILFYLKIEQMSLHQFEKLLGYDLWLRKMAHCTNHHIIEKL
jgi:hypothetical protein